MLKRLSRIARGDKRPAEKNPDKAPPARSEALEQRVLFSADLPWVSYDVAGLDAFEQVDRTASNDRLEAQHLETSSEDERPEQSPPLLLIDRSYSESQSGDVQDRYTRPGVETYSLDESTDGIDAVSTLLEARATGVNLNVVTTATEDGLRFGSATLSTSSVLNRVNAVADWSSRFNEDSYLRFFATDLELYEDREHFTQLMSDACRTAVECIPLEPGDDLDDYVESIACDVEEQPEIVDCAPDAEAVSVSREIVFIDPRIDDYRSLLNDIQASSDPSRQFDVILLDGNADGLAQIQSVLAQYGDVDAVHVLSHSSPGSLQIGGSWLSDDSVDGYADALASWSEFLAEDADLLFYGCDLAGSSGGISLLEKIRDYTGADVAASSDKTGHELLDANWQFEYAAGDIETEIAISEEHRKAYLHTLDIDTDLVLHLAFEEGSGTTATDSAGGDDNGVLTNSPAWVGSGAVGNDALDFSGDATNSNATVQVADSANLNFSGDFSVSFWYNSSTIPGTSTRLVGSHDGGSGFSIFADSSGDLNFFLQGSTGTNMVAEAGDFIANGQWHHVTAVRSGDQIRIYVDGSSDSSSTIAVGTVDPATAVTIGGESATSSDFEGMLDDVRIYTRALSASDIGELQALGTPGSPTGYSPAWGVDNSIEWITNVNFAGIDNTTGQEVGGYGDYTGQAGNVTVGTANTLSVSINPDSNDYISAWIDWNQDGDFTDAGEEYIVASAVGTTGPFTVDITAPEYATVGTTTMRVGLNWSAAPSPSGSHDYGEFEDYSINVAAANVAPDELAVSETTGGGLSINQDGGNDVYLIADDGGALLGGLTSLTYEQRYSTTDSGSQALVSYNVGGNDDQFKLVVQANGDMLIDVGSTFILSSAFDFSTLADGNEHTVSFTWDNASGDWALYVNGAVVDSGAGLATGETLTSGGALVIGNEQDSLGGDFSSSVSLAATLHDVRFFNDARSATEIAANHAATLPFDESGLLVNWRMADLSSGDVVTDAVSGNNLTVQHATGTGFVASTAELTLSLSEHSSTATVVGTVLGIDVDRQAQISAILASDPSLVYSAESNKFYRVVKTDSTWTNASTAATSASVNGVTGQLATIRSAAENELVAGFAVTAGKELWLGATDDGHEGRWLWIENGEETDHFWEGDSNGYNINDAFTNWQSGRPDNSGGDQNFLSLRANGDWNDEDDANPNMGYVIEWDADEVLDATQALTYSLQSQTVSGAFAIDADSGVITVADGSLLDYETNSTHNVSIRVTDVDGNFLDRLFTVALKDVAESTNAPTDLSNGIELNADGGNDAYLQADDGGAILGGLTSLTFETIVSVPSEYDDDSNHDNVLVSYGTSASADAFEVAIKDYGDMFVRVNGFAGSFTAVDYSNLLFDGEPHHFALTWDSTNGDIAVYVDGELIESKTGFFQGQSLSGTTGDGTLIFGQEQDSVGGGFETVDVFHGSVYDVRIWNEVRSEAEISQNWQHQFDTSSLPSGLIANWQMDGFDGSNDVVDVVAGNNLSIGSVVGAGFATSTPTATLSVSEHAVNGASVGFVVPTDSQVVTDIVADGRFLEGAPAGSTQVFGSGATVGGWTVESGNIETLGGWMSASPLGGVPVELAAGSTGTIVQTLDTVVGQTYQVTLAVTGDFSGGDAVKDLRVSAAGESADFEVTQPTGWTVTNPLWEHRTFTFTATSTTTDLRLTSLDTSSTVQSVVVSDVQVTAIPEAVQPILDADSTLTYDAATGKFYRYVHDYVSWSDAQSAAVGSSLNGISGQLVTIHSQYENDLIWNMSDSAYATWLGGGDFNTEGDFIWYDGAEPGERFWSGGAAGTPDNGFYTNFAQFQPDDYLGAQDALILRAGDGLWDDGTHASGVGTYVIEWDADEVLSNYTFALTDDAGGRFAIDSNTGEITVADSSLIDYESATSHTITVQTTDASGASYAEAMTIQIADASIDVIQTLPIAQSTDEDTTLVFSSGTGNAVVVSDGAAADGVLSVTLSVTNGTLELAQTSNLTFVAGANLSSTLTVTGLESDINAALDGLSYTPAAGYSGADTLTVVTALSDLDATFSFDSATVSGSTVADQSATGLYDGTLNGNASIVTDGTRGDVLSLDGDGDFIHIPGLIGEPDNVTLAAWINANSVDTFGAVAISMGTSPALYLGADGSLVGYYESGGTYNLVQSTESLVGTGWRHVAVSIDADSSSMTIFVDGEAVETTSTIGPIEYDNSPDTYIGRAGDGSTGFDFDGMIDDARIYSRALSAGEIAAIADGAGDVEGTVAVTVDSANDAPTFDTYSGFQDAVVGGSQRTEAIVVQPDGKILVAGYNSTGTDNSQVVRYNADGSIDTSFGVNGVATIDLGGSDRPYEMTLLEDGKIIISGHGNGDAAVARLNTDGSLDTTFGTGGITTVDILGQNTTAWDHAIAEDGSIYLSGNTNDGVDTDYAVIKLTADGVLDTTFGGTGYAVIDTAGDDTAWSIAIQDDGKVVVAGKMDNPSWDVGVARFNTDGTLDTSFGTNGIVITDAASGTDSVTDVLIQPDGKILVGGKGNPGGSDQAMLVRYNSDGSLDTGFGTNGVALGISGDLTTGQAIALLDDGSILMTGNAYPGPSTDAFVAKFTSAGVLDTSFAGGAGYYYFDTAGATDFGGDIAVNPDGTFFVATTSDVGNGFDFTLARFAGDGALDTSWGIATSTLDGVANFVEGGAAVLLDADVQIFDEELSGIDDFAGASLTLARNGGANADDVFSATGNLVFNAGTLELSSINVGTVTNTGGQLVLTFGAGVTNAQVNEVMRSIAYENTSDAPPATVQIDWSFSDGNSGAQGSGGALTATGSTTVNIAPAADVAITAPTSATTAEDTALIYSGANVIQVDDGIAADSRLRVTLSVSNGTLTLAGTTGITVVEGSDGSSSLVIDGLESDVNAALDGLTFTPNADYNGSDTLNVAVSLSADLEGLYTFDGGNAVDQSTGTGNDGTFIGDAGTTIDGERGEVLTLDGTGDSVQITGTFGSPADVTIGGWVNFTDNGVRNEFISLDDRVHIALDEAGGGVKGSFQTGASSWNDLSSDIFLGGDGWHHVMYTFDDANNVHSLYIDGELVASETTSTSIYWDSATTSYIGQHPSNGWNLNGQVDDVRVYDRALSAEEIAALAADNGVTVADTVAITITAVNDVPTIDLDLDNSSGATIRDYLENWSEGGGPVAIADSDAVLGDGDNPNMQSLTVTITNLLDGASEVLAANTAGTGIVASYNSGTGVLTLSGSDTVANYQQVLRTVTYDNGSSAPDTTARSITFVANDGTDDSAVATATVSIAATNDAPVLTTAPGGGTHFEGSSGTYFDVSVTVTDADVTDFDGGQMTVAVASNGESGDRLLVRDGNNVAVSGSDITYNFGGGPVVIGSFTGGDGVDPLVITFNASADATSVTAVGRQVAFRTASDAPSELQRALEMTVTDGDGGTSNTASRVMNVTAVNDGPVLTGLDATPTYVEEGAAVILDADVTVSDAELDSLNGGAGNYSGASVTLVRNGGAVVDDSFGFTGGSGISLSGSTLLKNGQVIATFDTTTTAGELVVTFSDANGEIPTSADVDAILQQLTYANTDDDPPASVQIDWTFSDGNTGSQGNGGALTDTGSIVVSLTVTNDAPVASAGGPYGIVEGAGLTLDASGSTDPEGDSLTYSWDLNNDGTYGDVVGVSPTLTWAQLQSFGIDDDGSYTIGVQIDDGDGGVSTDSTTLTVSNVSPTLSATGALTTAGDNVYTLNLSATDAGADTITSWTVNWGDGTIETFAGNPSSVTHVYSNDAAGLSFNITVSATDEDGQHYDADLLAPAYVGNYVAQFDGYDGAVLGTFAPNTDGISGHANIAIGPNGNYFVTGFHTDNVLEYAPDGSFVGTFVSPGAGGLDGAGGLAFGPDGNLYVTSLATDEVLRFDGATGAFIDVFVPSTTPGLDAPLGLVFDASGDLFVASRGSAGVLKFDGTTGVLDSGFNAASVSSAEDIAIGPDGNVYVASLNGGVLAFDSTTGASLGTFVSIGSGGLTSAAGIEFGPDGNLYVADQDGDAIRRYDGDTGAYIDDYATTSIDGPAYMMFTPDHTVTVQENSAPVVDLDADDSSASGFNFNAAWTEDGGPVLIADTDAVLTDTDDVDLDSITVTITNLLDGAAEVLAADTTGTSILASYDSGTGVLTLSGSDTLANYQQVLRTLSYDNASDTPDATSRVITIVANDGTSDSVSATSTVSVTGVNDPVSGQPVITGTAEEDQTLIADTSGISDADGLGLMSYQWFRDGVAISGANSDSLMLGDADVGSSITVEVSYTDGQGTAESTTSAAVGPVTNVNDPVSGQPVITGTPTEDQMLTADTSGISDADGLGAFSYQWYRDGVAISGETNSTLTLGDADVGANITVEVSYTDGQGTAESTTSAAVGPVTNVNDPVSGQPVITGTPEEDQTLTADTSGISDADGLGAFSYQWYRDGVAITGETASTLVLGDADVGANITVEVSYTDGQGTAESTTSAAVGPVTNVNDPVAGQPVITGTPEEDQTLTADTSGISDADGLGAFSYQWYRDGVAIAGETNATLVLDDADVGTNITVEVSYTDGQGTAESTTSAAVGPVTNVNDPVAGQPVITGTPEEDQTLTADTSGLSDADGLGAFSYQWYRDGVAIVGETASTLVLGDADVGANITVEVSYTDGQGTAESTTSAAVGPVTNVNDPVSGQPVITGTPEEDQTLTADTSGISDADGLGAFSYQWYRDGVAIAGETNSTLTLGDADVGANITVEVSYTDGQGTAESTTSAAVGPVTNVNDPVSGQPVITGTPQEDQTLTADTSGISDADGLGALSYQWYRDGVAITGETNSTLTLGDADVGANITVEVSYTDGQGTAELTTSAAVGPVTNVNDPVSGQPVITGTPEEDQTLTADTSAISDADGLGAFSYQWYRDGVAISGETNSTLTLGDADVGSNITVEVSYTDGQGTAESTTSAAVGPVTNVNDPVAGQPVITGTPTEDQTLTADTSSISDADGLGAFSYQWYRDGVAISGETASTLTLGDTDVGSNITVEVSYTDGQGTAESTTSAAVGPVTNVNDPVSGQPVITGTPQEDQTLTADTSGISDADGLGALSYQWYRDGVAIAGETNATLVLDDADVGANITVEVSYTDGHGTAESATSAAVGPVINVNDAPSNLVVTNTANGGLSINQDGGNDTYFIADDGDAILGGLTELSTEVRFSMDSFANTQFLVSYATPNHSDTVRIGIHGGGEIRLLINGDRVDSTAMDYRTLADGEEHTLSVTWDSAGGLWELYVDGVLVDSGSGLATGESVHTGGALIFGNEQDSVDGGYDRRVPLSATLYDVRFFDQVRTAGDVSGNFDQTVASTEPGLLANWTFNDLSTDGVVTDTVSGNNLTERHLSGAGFVASTPELTAEVDENAANGTLVAAVNGIDVDAGDSLSYTFVDDAGGRFAIDSSGLITVADGSLLNFEAASSHDVTVRVTDAAGLTYDGVVTIDVRDLNEAPVIAVPGAQVVSEDTLLAINGVNVGDEDGNLSSVQLSVNDGLLNVALSGGATISAGVNGSNTMTVFGSQADINATLATLTYQGDPDFFGSDALNVIATDSSGASDVAVVAITVANVNDPVAGQPVITGTPTEDQTLTADTSGISDADGLGALSYQWYRDGVAIAGETASTLVLGDADVGTNITVEVSYTDGQGTAESTTSAAVGPVTNVNDPVSGQPVITGTPEEDQTLTADTSGISDADGLGTFGYQWYRDGSAITGETASTLTLGDADVGANITVEVSYTDGQGTAESTTSAAVGPVTNVNDPVAGQPVITGTPEEDQSLSADTSGISDADGLGAFSYQWYSDGVAIAGETNSTLTLGDADVGTNITVEVSYTDGQGTAESTTSAAVGPVTNVNDPVSGQPVITGTPEEDQTLTADTSGISDADGLGTFSYQWYRDGVAIAGETNATLVLDDADVGANITVAVSYTDGQGTAESTTSAVVGPVTNVNDAPTGDVSIDNLAPNQGDTLTASNTLADIDGISATISYQWYRDGIAVAGAVGSTYTTTQGDVGSQLSVVASYVDDQGTAESVVSAPTATVANVNDGVAGQPVITGTPEEDQTLTANTSGISDADGLGAFSYQWYRDGAVIAGETSSTLVLGDTDVGANITVEVSYTDGFGNAETVVSAAVGPVANVNDAPTAGVDTFQINEDSGLAINGVADLTVADIDGDTLSLQSVSAPTNGTVTDNGDGTWSYTPDADFNGSETLSYVVTDASGATATGTMIVDVMPVNDAPVATPHLPGLVSEGSTDAGYISSTDVDGDVPRFRITGGSDAAMMQIDPATGQLSFINAPDYESPVDADGDNLYDVVVTVEDSSGGSQELQLQLQVGNVNEAPVATDSLYSVNQSGIPSVVGQVIATDPDSNDTLTFEVIGGDGQPFFDVDAGSGAVASSGAVAAGIYDLQVRIVDAAGDSTVANVSILVEANGASQSDPLVSTPPGGTPTDRDPGTPSTSNPSDPSNPSGSDDSTPTADVPTSEGPGASSPDTDTPDSINSELLPEFDPTQPLLPDGTVAPGFSVSNVLSQVALLDEAGQQALELRLRLAFAAGERDVASVDAEDEDEERAGQFIDSLAFQLSPEVLAAIEELARDAEQRIDLTFKTAGVAIASISLSAGFIMWMLRAGSLLASMLATRPVWAEVDPLPIFGRKDGERDGLWPAPDEPDLK